MSQSNWLNDTKITELIRESNAIEGIIREVLPSELDVTKAFLNLPQITVDDLQGLVKAYQPDALLRDQVGLDVYVGNHQPPCGDPHIRVALEHLLSAVSDKVVSSYEAHIAYEMLHPFTDGNGRSGRMLWLWLMCKTDGILADGGFLHTFYYQSLDFIQSSMNMKDMKEFSGNEQARLTVIG